MSQLKRPVVLAVLGIALGVIGTSHAVDLQEGQRFFDRYVALGNSYNPSIATLYADSAAIKTTRRYPTGQIRSLELTGAQWKDLIQKAMPLAKAQGDRSEFKNARFEAVGDDIRVKADRYSVRKCYWDRGYYMVIRRTAAGLQIVEEYSETQPESAC
ncbi:MAG TPA: hypothetical protein VFS81_00135 [Candidatus Binatia bacterium]|nr:hypothetical protein [Candidatus Binatia bacterium]